MDITKSANSLLLGGTCLVICLTEISQL